MISPTVELPALDGREPLGFLAALGLLQILTNECHLAAQLAFSATTGCARLSSPLQNSSSIADAVTGIINHIPAGAVLPGGDPRFPPPSASGKDPLRQERPNFSALGVQARARDSRTADLWLPALVTDLALDNQGRCAITPLSAPSGQQKLRTFFEKPLQEVQRNPAYIHQALTSWQRVEGCTGEYLDHRVLHSNADDVRGRAGQETGVPGATWLAIMALPLLRLTGNAGHRAATLWHRTGNRSLMLWPLWEALLDTSAVQVLLSHPALKPADDQPTVSTRYWQPLGIFNVYAAERQRITGRTFEGVLAPIHVSKTTSTPHRH